MVRIDSSWGHTFEEYMQLSIMQDLRHDSSYFVEVTFYDQLNNMMLIIFHCGWPHLLVDARRRACEQPGPFANPGCLQHGDKYAAKMWLWTKCVGMHVLPTQPLDMSQTYQIKVTTDTESFDLDFNMDVSFLIALWR